MNFISSDWFHLRKALAETPDNLTESDRAMTPFHQPVKGSKMLLIIPSRKDKIHRQPRHLECMLSIQSIFFSC